MRLHPLYTECMFQALKCVVFSRPDDELVELCGGGGSGGGGGGGEVPDQLQASTSQLV